VDFACDALATGCGIRILAIVDTYVVVAGAAADVEVSDVSLALLTTGAKARLLLLLQFGEGPYMLPTGNIIRSYEWAYGAPRHA
jgi:hypothetical protein